MKKYLITGGCGFIGSHLADHLIGQGYQVRILDNLSTGKRENAPPQAELLIGSITDRILLNKALQDIDGVFHLAAIPSIQKSIQEWGALHQINGHGTIILCEALSTLERKIPLVYASSASVYGNPSTLPIPEDSLLSPLSPYGLDKQTGEGHLKLLWDLFKIPSLSYRFFNVYGPRQEASSPYAGVIAHFAEKIKRNEVITIYGSGAQLRDFIYVGDVARILSASMESAFEGASIYNLCTGTGTSINDLAHLMGKMLNVDVQKIHAPPRQGDIEISIGNPNRLKFSLGLKPTYTVEEGLCASSILF